jgi:hypothetical protein
VSNTETKLKKIVRAGPGYVEVIVIAMIMACIVVAAYDRLFAQKIKMLDLKAYLRTQKALLMAGEISEQQWRTGLDTVEQILNDEAASSPNQIILLKDVVLRNGKELKISK